MSDLHDFEKQVMDWYESKWNGRVLPFFKKPALTIETSLSTGKYPWANEDAIEIVDDYFRRFNVDRKNFSFVKYWPNEEVILPLNFLRSKEHKWRWIEPESLTLKMLAESAKAGYWLYD
ncbi:MAG: DUF1493 family protein [Pantoea sp.]|uniref:DUF1493 family protein n=1 Tax=Pantoea sp. TaxID=69393 RepID=UPI00290012E6|nr:DUF1493 family protein [Pantoea sp.]MDU1571864.1 DUF1493 family protein [Pantoea sp.]